MARRPGEACCHLRRPGRLALCQGAEMAELDRGRRAGERLPVHAEARLRAAHLPVPVPEVPRPGPAEPGADAQRHAILLADALDVYQESRLACDQLEDLPGILAQLTRYPLSARAATLTFPDGPAAPSVFRPASHRDPAPP